MSQYKILIVEDDAIESMDIQKRLELLGYHVPYVATRGQEAIEKASELMPDLVLMDISLKGSMDGIEAAQEIRKLDIPIIYLTAHSDEATVQKAKTTEPYGYIIKPYEHHELKYALEMALYKSKSDKKLKESQVISKALLNASNDSVFLIDTEGRFLAVNSATAKRLGFKESELIGNKFKEYIDPQTAKNRSKYLKKAIKNRETVEFEDVRNGIYFHHTISPIVEGDEVKKLAVFSKDITEKKKAEKSLKISEERLKLALDSAGAALFDLDITTGNAYLSPEYYEMFGYEPGEFPAHLEGWKKIIHPEDLENTLSDLDKQLKNKLKYLKIEYRAICKDKTVKWIVGTAKAVEFDEEGFATRIIGVNIDMTQQKILEEKLELTQHSVDNAQDMIFWIDSQGNIVYANDSASEKLGYSPQELQSRTIFDKLDPTFEEDLWKKHWEEIKKVGQKTIETQIPKKDGELIDVSLAINLIDFKGTLYHCDIARDITAQKELERNLKSAKKSLEEQYNFLQNILDRVPSPIFYKDINYKYQGCNRAFEEVIGISRKDIIGKTVYDLNPPELAEKFHAMDEELFKNPGEQKYEAPVQYKDGSIHDILFIKNTYYDPDGNLAGMIGVMSDITDIKNAAKSLEISQEEYRGIFENINTAVAVYETRDNGKTFLFKDFNRAGAEIENVDQKEVIGKKISDVFPGVEEFGILDAIKRVWKTGTPEKFPLGFYEDERISGWRENYIYKLASGEVVAVYEDMTEQKQAQEEIELNQERLKVLVKILQYNPGSVQELLEYALEQSIKLTQSKIGYIYHYYPDKKQFVLNTWSKGVMDECSINEPNNIYELNKTGIWGEAVRQKKSFIINDFQAPHPLKKGYPKGHAPLYKYMTLPVFSKGEIVAVVGVANKETDYTETDLLQLELLMDAVWKMVDRQKTEEALKQSETEYKAIFENTGTAMAISENDMTLSLVNEEFAQLTGYSQDEIVNKMAWTEFFVEEKQERMKEYHRLRRIDPAQAPKNYESQVLDKSGHIKDVYMSVSIIPGTKKSLVSLMDITEKKRSREKLKRELKINQSLARIYTPIISPDSNIEDISSVILNEAKELTGSDHGFVSSIDPKTESNIGHTLTQMMPDCNVMIKEEKVEFPKGPDGLYNGLWGHSLNTGQSFFTNSPQQHESSKGVPEGHLPIKKFLSVPVFFGKRLVGQIALANPTQDYSKQDLETVERLSEFYALAIHSKEAEKELKDSLDEKETLLREIHHRVKNNMQIISSLLNLQKYWDAERDPQELIEDSQNRIKTMSIVHELLYQSEKLSKVNLKTYIEKLSHYLFEQYSASDRKIRLRTDLEENYLNIETAVPCCLIVNELVSNSLKHAFPSGEGEVSIALHRINDHYELTVADNGIGLPEDLDLEKTSTLGLYLVNSLVKQIDGTLKIESEEGVAVTIIFKELIYSKRL